MQLWTAASQPFTFPLRVRSFLGNGTGLEQIPDQMQRSLANREARFLDLVERLVYARPRSPYRRLLEHAGCAFADVRDLTRRHGLEGALEKLAEAGVYLSAAELKGKQEVVRGPLRFMVSPDELRMVSRGVQSQSSGNSNAPQRGTSSFEWMAQQTTVVGAFALAHGLQSHLHSAFEPMLPGQAGTMFMLMLARLGIPCERWFARAVPFRNRLERLYFAVLARELAEAGTRFGPGFGKPEEVWDNAPTTIIRWIVDNRARIVPHRPRGSAYRVGRLGVAREERIGG